MFKNLSKKIKNQFVAGLIVILPIGLTVWIVTVLFNLIGRRFLPLFASIPELQILPMSAQMLISAILTILVIWFIGLWAKNYIGKSILKGLENIVLKTPVVSKIYVTIRKITDNMFVNQQGFKKVGIIEYPRKGIFTVVFVTNERIVIENKVFTAVFVPSTPNPTTGYCIVLPQDEVRISEMSLNQAMEFVFSGGMIVPPKLDFDPIGEIK